MAKKKRFRPRSSGGSSNYGGNREGGGRDGGRGSANYVSGSQGGGGGRGPRRPPTSRRRKEYGSADKESFPEPQVDENGEIPLLEFSGILEMHPNGYGFLRSPD
ncbi:MAG: hypothetical protein KDA45_05165, partial [Planctomycetales bacterium]|nr:hypothetical protein [Planctomycetales bacterium]